mmetsp:Transcript_29745/g.86195  ORF Transcript_29745/g.86195 Transcript_29745/m.86195 type:complete len:255 (+) Transcript_29745:697-1461(+)
MVISGYPFSRSSAYSHAGLFKSNLLRKRLKRLPRGRVCRVRMVSRLPPSRSPLLLTRSSVMSRWRAMRDSWRNASHRPSKTARLPTASTSALPNSIGSRPSPRPWCTATLTSGSHPVQSPLLSRKYASRSSESTDVSWGEMVMMPWRPLATSRPSMYLLTSSTTTCSLVSLSCAMTACLVASERAAFLISTEQRDVTVCGCGKSATGPSAADDDDAEAAIAWSESVCTRSAEAWSHPSLIHISLLINISQFHVS